MLKHTQKIKHIYEDIQRKIYYMIPEKWDKLYLYASVIDAFGNTQTGELFFYYIPKGIFKKNPVNVYEIPSKFNLNETEYIKLVKVLYDKIKQLREEFRKIEYGVTWSNLTISIHNFKFIVDYSYENLKDSNFSSYERHIIWRYKHLNIGIEQLNKQEKEILNRYLTGEKSIIRHEKHESSIYIKNIKNIVDYETEEYSDAENIDYITKRDNIINKNQILLSKEEIEKNKL